MSDDIRRALFHDIRLDHAHAVDCDSNVVRGNLRSILCGSLKKSRLTYDSLRRRDNHHLHHLHPRILLAKQEKNAFHQVQLTALHFGKNFSPQPMTSKHL
jgi:hypothetical protein